MRKLIVLLATLGGLVLFIPSAGAQTPNPSPVYSWGGHSFTDTPAADGIASSGGPAEFSDVTTTNSNTYVLDNSTGEVWAVGATGAGLGNGTANTPPDEQKPAPTTTFVQVLFPATPNDNVFIKSLASVGPNGTEMAIDSNGNVWGWGLNSYDQLCGATGQQDTPIRLNNLQGHSNPDKLPAGVYTLASGAGDHASYYNSSTNTIYSCGDKNTDGELGDGTTDSPCPSSPPSTPCPPVAVPPFDNSGNPVATVTAMTASVRNEGVIMSDGTYWNWGNNDFDQLAQPSSVQYKDVPTPVNFSVPYPYQVVQAAEGGGGKTDSSTMALLSDLSDPGSPYTYYGWGDDTQGQLCDGQTGTVTNPTLEYDTPTAIMIPLPNNEGTLSSLISSVAAGGKTGYVLTTSGAVYGCGDNSLGQLGNGSRVTPSPPDATLIVSGASQISSTNWNTAALVPNGG
jgi:alpha-tubulin suppressor-like RCC1 family protein